MRCYFMRDGHIGAVELLTDASDTEAIAQALELFAKRQDKYAGFEVWDRARFVYRFPKSDEDDKSSDEPVTAA